MHWTATPIHIIDFEGTKAYGIIEYGIVTLHNNRITQTHTRLCQPTGNTPIPLQDSRLHGIYESHTQDALPFSSDWPLFSSLRSSGPLAAHHAQTENMLIKDCWPYTKNSPDWIDPQRSSTSWGPWIDTCQLFKTLFPQLDSHKLMSLINAFKLCERLTALSQEHCPDGRNKPHCALYDALASSLLLQYVGSIAEFQNISTHWLLVNSASSQYRQSLEQRSFDFNLS